MKNWTTAWTWANILAFFNFSVNLVSNVTKWYDILKWLMHPSAITGSTCVAWMTKATWPTLPRLNKPSMSTTASSPSSKSVASSLSSGSSPGFRPEVEYSGSNSHGATPVPSRRSSAISSGAYFTTVRSSASICSDRGTRRWCLATLFRNTFPS